DLPVLDNLPPEWSGAPILCIAGRGPFDGLVAMMLGQLLAKHGLGSRVEADAAASSSTIVRLSSADVNTVFLSYLDVGPSPAHMRHSIQRLRRQIPGAALVAGLWGHHDSGGEPLQGNAAADFYVFSLREALSICIDAIVGHRDKPDGPRDAKSGT